MPESGIESQVGIVHLEINQKILKENFDLLRVNLGIEA